MVNSTWKALSVRWSSCIVGAVPLRTFVIFCLGAWQIKPDLTGWLELLASITIKKTKTNSNTMTNTMTSTMTNTKVNTQTNQR